MILSEKKDYAAVITYKTNGLVCDDGSVVLFSLKTNLTKTPAYLSDIIHEYHPTRTLRSADKLLLVVARMSLTLLAKAFCVSAPSVWNSLSYNC